MKRIIGRKIRGFEGGGKIKPKTPSIHILTEESSGLNQSLLDHDADSVFKNIGKPLAYGEQYFKERDALLKYVQPKLDSLQAIPYNPETQNLRNKLHNKVSDTDNMLESTGKYISLVDQYNTYETLKVKNKGKYYNYAVFNSEASDILNNPNITKDYNVNITNVPQQGIATIDSVANTVEPDDTVITMSHNGSTTFGIPNDTIGKHMGQRCSPHQLMIGTCGGNDMAGKMYNYLPDTDIYYRPNKSWYGVNPTSSNLVDAMYSGYGNEIVEPEEGTDYNVIPAGYQDGGKVKSTKSKYNNIVEKQQYWNDMIPKYGKGVNNRQVYMDLYTKPMQDTINKGRYIDPIFRQGKFNNTGDRLANKYRKSMSNYIEKFHPYADSVIQARTNKNPLRVQDIPYEKGKIRYDLKQESDSLYKSYLDDPTSRLPIQAKTTWKQIFDNREDIDNKELLFASLMDEGGDRFTSQAAKNMNYYGISGFKHFGLDTVGDKFSGLVKDYGLDPTIGDRSLTASAMNEKGNMVNTLDFTQLNDVVSAKNAYFIESKDKISQYVQDNNIELSPEAMNYFMLASFNYGETGVKKMINAYSKADILKDNKFLEDDSYGGYRQIHKNVTRRLQSAAMLRGENTMAYSKGGKITNTMNNISNIRGSRIKLIQDKGNYPNKMNVPERSWGGVAGSTLTGAGTGAAIGSAFPGLGTAIGAVAGAAVGFGVGYYKHRQDEKRMKIAKADMARSYGRQKMQVDNARAEYYPDQGHSQYSYFEKGGSMNNRIGTTRKPFVYSDGKEKQVGAGVEVTTNKSGTDKINAKVNGQRVKLDDNEIVISHNGEDIVLSAKYGTAQRYKAAINSGMNVNMANAMFGEEAKKLNPNPDGIRRYGGGLTYGLVDDDTKYNKNKISPQYNRYDENSYYKTRPLNPELFNKTFNTNTRMFDKFDWTPSMLTSGERGRTNTNFEPTFRNEEYIDDIPFNTSEQLSRKDQRQVRRMNNPGGKSNFSNFMGNNGAGIGQGLSFLGNTVTEIDAISKMNKNPFPTYHNYTFQTPNADVNAPIYEKAASDVRVGEQTLANTILSHTSDSNAALSKLGALKGRTYGALTDIYSRKASDRNQMISDNIVGANAINQRNTFELNRHNLGRYEDTLGRINTTVGLSNKIFDSVNQLLTNYKKGVYDNETIRAMALKDGVMLNGTETMDEIMEKYIAKLKETQS